MDVLIHRILDTASRQGISGKEERYVDARLQVQELREALLLKEKEVEELRALRNYLPTSVGPVSLYPILRITDANVGLF